LRYSTCMALGIETTNGTHTYMPGPVYEQEDVQVLWNQAVHTVTKVMANRPDIIIKNKQNMHIDSHDCSQTEM